MAEQNKMRQRKPRITLVVKDVRQGAKGAVGWFNRQQRVIFADPGATKSMNRHPQVVAEA